MKKIFLIIICLFTFSFSYSQEKVNWLKINEVDNIKNIDKRVFIDCYTLWCGWCKRMDKDTFSNDTIARIMNSYFYSVKFNAEEKEPIFFNGKKYINKNDGAKRQSPHDLAKQLLDNRMAYPSFSILNPDLSIATIIPGYYLPKDFEPILVFMGKGYDKEYSWEEFQKIYPTKIRPTIMKEIFK
ncbi:MAG: DUF255 domain-containing protein [Bacteroidales bacterium]|jgi:thioredoxin-related protein|nr:DUF255 domain-containing protein [Bacteroidales bacterium]